MTRGTAANNGGGVKSAPTDAIKRLFDVVRILDVGLLDCRAYLRGDTSKPLLLAIQRRASGSRSPDRTQTCAQVRFTLEGREELPNEGGGQPAQEEKSGGPKLLIEATFNALYSVPENLEVDDEALNLFAHTNGTFNLWPYWREFVQAMSARMGLHGLTVPTYRVEEAFTGPGTTDRARVQAAGVRKPKRRPSGHAGHRRSGR